jgi:hypothetical protein
MDAAAQPYPASRYFDPPQRGSQATVERISEPPEPLPPEPASPPLQPDRSMRPPRERKEGECHDKVDRPPQVPRLDLSSIHAKEGDGGKSEKLGTQQWMKPGKNKWNETGPQYPAPNVDKAALERGDKTSQPQGFSCATVEDQQRIAEYYGYRDEGFVATMHGLRTDCIRPRLYCGTMADAAYWPLVQSLCITHILNVAVEAQRGDPPYDSQGIQYMLIPWHDSAEQTHSVYRQKFRQLREATRFIHKSLQSTFQWNAAEKKASVLVHCVQGLNRSAAIVCAYLMEYEGLSLDRALAEVKSKHQGCLSSRHWQDFLHKFNAELLRGF